MNGLTRIKNNWRDLQERLGKAKPGTRFTQEYERQAKREDGAIKRYAILLIASLLTVIGLLLSIPPGVPGFLLWIPALALLASRSLWAAMALDRMELTGYTFVNKLRRHTNKSTKKL